MQDKYYRSLATLNDPALGEPVPVIEKLRHDYFQKITSGKITPLEDLCYHPKQYSTHEQLFMDICVITELVYDHFNRENIHPILERSLKKLGFSEDEITIKVLARSTYDLRRNLVDFYELLIEVFSPSNFLLDELKYGKELGEIIWNESLKDKTDVSLDRLIAFKKFKGMFLHVTIALFVIAITLGIFSLSSLNPDSFSVVFTVIPIAFAIVAIFLTVVSLHRLLRIE